MDSMNGHFSTINRLKYVNGIQFSLCGTPINLIFAHRGLSPESQRDPPRAKKKKKTSPLLFQNFPKNENSKDFKLLRTVPKIIPKIVPTF